MIVIKFTNLIVPLILVTPNIAGESPQSLSRPLLGEVYPVNEEESSVWNKINKFEESKEKHIRVNWCRVFRRDFKESELFYAMTVPDRQGANTINRMEIFKFPKGTTDYKAVQCIANGEGNDPTFKVDFTQSTWDDAARDWAREVVELCEHNLRPPVWKTQRFLHPGEDQEVIYIVKFG